METVIVSPWAACEGAVRPDELCTMVFAELAESSVSEWYRWGRLVSAPFDGEVVKAIDTVPDRTTCPISKPIRWKWKRAQGGTSQGGTEARAGRQFGELAHAPSASSADG